jgi:hypothetical protein
VACTEAPIPDRAVTIGDKGDVQRLLSIAEMEAKQTKQNTTKHAACRDPCLPGYCTPFGTGVKTLQPRLQRSAECLQMRRGVG